MAERVRLGAAQYTPGRESVMVPVFSADAGGLWPPSRPYLCHTTQAALVALIASDVRAAVGDRWSDDEVTAAVVADLAERGLAVTVVS